jgi:hypothetical protein
MDNSAQDQAHVTYVRPGDLVDLTMEDPAVGSEQRIAEPLRHQYSWQVDESATAGRDPDRSRPRALAIS